jgi:hypothetical protein
MKIVSRNTAFKNFEITRENRCKFDGGKYAHSMAGKDVPVQFEKNVKVVWCERRTDKYGVYYALFCIPNDEVN